VLAGDENPTGIASPFGPGRVNEGRATLSVLNTPLNELSKTAHELKGITSATEQDELPLLLKRVGDNVESFVRNLPSTASTEDVRQETLDSADESTAYRFRYLALPEQGTLATRLKEFRQDSAGREVDAQRMMRGSPIVTRGFVSMPLLFHPQYRTGADFRLLGRQALERHETYVIGFAQRNSAVFSGGMNLSGSWTTFLVQGVAWVDSTTCQILRLKTWLLPEQASVAEVTTTVNFSEVRFKHNSLAFWLPQDVVVEVVWKGKLYTNRHHYSDYKVFTVEAGEKAPHS
jgi:hypothetical protein